jgi:5-methylcytosine-specific restriction endonuclease McrA
MGIRRLCRIFPLSKSGIRKRLGKLVKIEDRSCKKITKWCLTCRTELTGCQKSFCSQSCSATFHHAESSSHRPCTVCGTLHLNEKFCSWVCSGASIRKTDEHKKAKRRVTNLLGVRRYQARRFQQTPEDADQHQIRQIYVNCPNGHEVDHVIPISKGGLHHQSNLQYLLKPDNRRKSNKLNYTPMAERLGN